MTLEAGVAQEVNPETLFQAASISKPVTAAAALTMVQAGKLSLDEDVNDKLTSWKVPANEFTRKAAVTLRGLFSHTAGMTVHGFPGYASGAGVPTVVEVLDGEGNTDPVRVDMEPRTQRRYSGGGYTVAQLLMTDVVGQPFPEILREAVLEPVGMTSSTFEQPLPESLHANAARAHNSDGSPVKGRWHTYPEMAAAGLWTTAADLARFFIELREAHRGESDRILSQTTAEDMLTAHIGLITTAEDGDIRFGHGGANKGFRCDARIYLNSGDGVVVMTNSDGGDRVYDEIMRAVAAEYSWPGDQPTEKEVVPLDPAALAAFAGSYRFENFTATVEAAGEKLRIKAPGLGEHEILPESELGFFSLESRVPPLTFGKNGQGEVTHLRIGRNQGKKIE